MMTPEELRIGNYVECEGCIAKVKVIDSRTHDVLVWKLNGQEWCGKVEKLKPLHICERIILACKQFREGEIKTSEDEYGRTEWREYSYNKRGFISRVFAFYDIDGMDEGRACTCSVEDTEDDLIYEEFCEVHLLQNRVYYFQNRELEFDDVKLSEIHPLCWNYN